MKSRPGIYLSPAGQLGSRCSGRAVTSPTQCDVLAAGGVGSSSRPPRRLPRCPHCDSFVVRWLEFTSNMNGESLSVPNLPRRLDSPRRDLTGRDIASVALSHRPPGPHRWRDLHSSQVGSENRGLSLSSRPGAFIIPAMPWKCPACSIQIRHGEAEERPRPHAVYRCHVCRLELMLNEGTGKLDVTPWADQEPTSEQAA